jgi:hypothetical protein
MDWPERPTRLAEKDATAQPFRSLLESLEAWQPIRSS